MAKETRRFSLKMRASARDGKRERHISGAEKSPPSGRRSYPYDKLVTVEL